MEEYDKFDQHKDGRYWNNYFNKNIEFYRLIQDHIKEFLSDQSTFGLDIGAGPGVGARLCADAGIETRLVGYEPSETHFDGVKFAEELKESRSSVFYEPYHGGITDIQLKSNLDYMTILRASHEIAGSLKGKDRFIEELRKLTPKLNKGGAIILGEPQFHNEIMENPQNYQSVISKVQKWQLENIEHYHVPSDYFTHKEMKQIIESIGFKLQREDIQGYRGEFEC